MKSVGKLPPLTSLRVFHCVGRLQNFRAAGEELCITQSAVSYHVKLLEADLGVKLFERHARGIAFTSQGASYFDLICKTFESLESASDALRNSDLRVSALRVSVLPSFAAGWLVKHLGSFRTKHPGIDVLLEPGLGLADLGRGEADMAIRYGRGDWPGVDCELIVQERLCPIAAPALAGSDASWDAAIIAASPILQVSRPYEWELWAEAEGVALSGTKIQLADYNIVLQAALDGIGIALGREFLVKDKLSAGLLRPLQSRWVSPDQLGYWICLPKISPSQPAQVFSSWLRSAAARENSLA